MRNVGKNLRILYMAQKLLSYFLEDQIENYSITRQKVIQAPLKPL